MFQDQQVIGVLLGIALIATFVIISIRATRSLVEKDKIMFLMIFLVSILAGVWATDKVIAFKTHLLDPEENKFIMGVMNDIIFLIVGRGSVQVVSKLNSPENKKENE
jgi:hypothetical protein